jgi:predicted aconitase with swiveling domain
MGGEMKLQLKVSVANRGVAEGEALVCKKPFTFRDVNPTTGIVDTPGHELIGSKVTEKIMICPCSSGVSTEEFTMYALKKAGFSPKAIVNGQTTFYISIAGAILAGIPMVYGLGPACLSLIQNGDYVKVDADRGIVEVSRV